MNEPILIVGAGPTGLVLALWLTRAGVPFRIIEKNSGPGQASRAMVVQARTLEFYRQLGIADRVVASGIKIDGIKLRSGTRQIAGFQFDDIGAGISPYPFALSFPQDDHEHLLVTVLAEAGVNIEWNTQLVHFVQDGQRVHTTLRKNDADVNCEFEYLCGCDGAHSTVRQGLGMGFPGGTYEQMFYVADVAASGAALTPQVNACLARHSFLLGFPVRSSGMFRLIGVVPEELAGNEHLTFDDLRPHVQQQMAIEVRQVNWFATYHVHHRVADHFRQGRVFISGDAAHIHSPAGGQGMNTGIGDAVNLAWKLAGVIRGSANPSILDTYDSERIAFARLLVKTTDRAFQGLVGRGLAPALFRSVFLRVIIPLLLRSRSARRAQFRLVSQTQIHYRKSALSSGSAGNLIGGDRLPWLLHQDNFNPLRARDWQLHVYGNATETCRALAVGRNIALHEFTFNAESQTAGLVRDAAYLIRPDGHIGFASPSQQIPPLENYLARWMIGS